MSLGGVYFFFFLIDIQKNSLNILLIERCDWLKWFTILIRKSRWEESWENPSVQEAFRTLALCHCSIVLFHLTQFFIPFYPDVALEELKKTIKEQLSVQGRIYWHLLLIYGPLLCGLSALCQPFFLLYISWGDPHAGTERQSPSVCKLFVR